MRLPRNPKKAPKGISSNAIPSAQLKRSEKANAARAERDAVTKLHKAGNDRAVIAKEIGITISRVTFVPWHPQYGLDGTPGVPEYSKEAKAEAQKRYLADMEARKQAKAAG